MCKWTTRQVDFDELNLLVRLVPHLDGTDNLSLYLFSRSGFTDRVVSYAAADPRLHLVTPAEIYADRRV